MPYRDEGPLAVENDKVLIDREEYAHLRRAAEIIDHVEGGADIYYEESRRRYRWRVDALGEYTDYGRTCEEGRGRTFTEAVEIAFDLPPVEPWCPPEPLPVPWRRWVLMGVTATLVVQQWVYPMLTGAL